MVMEGLGKKKMLEPFIFDLKKIKQALPCIQPSKFKPNFVHIALRPSSCSAAQCLSNFS